MNRINILIYGMSSSYGGIESFIMNVFRNINRKRAQFDFVCYDKKPACHQEILELGGMVYIVPERRRNYFIHCKKLKKLMKEKNYDIVWSNLNSLSDILILKFAFLYSIRMRIAHVHNSDLPPKIITKILHSANKTKIVKYATDFWACSYVAGRFFFTDSILQSSQFKIIYNAIEVSNFVFNQTARNMKRDELKLKDNIIIGHIGGFRMQKNHGFLLKVFLEIYKKNENAVLLLVGDGSLRKDIEEQINIYGLKDNVRLLGNRKDISELLNAMDVFVFPSHYEGLGIALIEAQAAGLSCFISDVIPHEAVITKNVYPISLCEPAAVWADVILKNVEYRREDTAQVMQNSGYDIKTEVLKIERFFLSNNRSSSCKEYM
jgi:glycosyltransferase involved in cell wall biosynthesis